MTDGDGRTKRVTFYVSEDEREALKREAEQEGKSLSGYVLQLVRRQRQLDAEEQLAADLNVEQRLEETTARVAEKAIEEITESVTGLEQEMAHLRNLQAQSGAYSVVNFRALKRAHNLPEPWIDDQFTKARDTLREGDAETAGENESDQRDGESESESESGPTDVDDLV